jgi:RsiW-degrading membrane proteinase PrsW (M82 family)
MIIAILICILIPLFFLYLIWTFEVYGTSQFQWVVAALAWGMAACGIAFLVQTALLEAQWLTLLQLRLLLAPLFEETLKAALLLWLARRLVLRYPLDGATYGFAIGVGFSMVENLLYILDSEQPLALALARVLSAGLMHSFTAGVLGTLLGSLGYLRQRTRLLWTAASFGFTVLGHAFYNLMILTAPPSLTLLTGISLGMLGILIIVQLVLRGLQREEHTIRQQLQSQVSQGEMAATLNPYELGELLTRHQAALGQKRTQAVRKYVTLQAQRALVSHLMALNPQPSKQKALQHDLTRLEGQLQMERAQMGFYTWTWLRSVLPSEESSLWQHMEASLEDEHPTLELIQEITRRRPQIDPTELAERQAVLGQLRLFQQLGRADLEDVAILMSKQAYPIGAVVIRQGQFNAYLYCVVEGQLAQIQTQPDGSDSIVVSYSEHSLFGEVSMIDNQRTDSRVECLSDTLLYAIHQEDVWRLMYGNPSVAVALLRELAGDLRRQNQLLAALLRPTV